MSYSTMSDVAHELGVSLLTVHRHIRAGRLVAEKGPGRNGPVRISRSALAAFRARERDLAASTVDTATAAHMLGVAERTVQRLVGAGQLDTVPNRGRGLRITRSSVTAHRRRSARGE